MPPRFIEVLTIYWFPFASDLYVCCKMHDLCGTGMKNYDPSDGLKNALRRWKWHSVFFLLRFHSHLYFSSLICSSSLATVFFFHTSLRSWSCSTFVRLTILHSVPPPHPLYWHHCWRSVISQSNNRQLLCYSVELVSLLCSPPTVHDGAFAARWHHLSGHSASL